MSIRYKFANLLTEGYNFTNSDEVIEAIKANKVGVKIQPWAKQEQGSIPKKLALDSFFKKCEEMGIKDTTYGIQLLLSKCKTLGAFRVATNADGLYEFLKSYKKPWVKQLPEYKQFIESNDFNLYIHPLEKAIQEEQSKHGKVAKGSGQLKDVKTVYDDGIWKLLIPTSFEGEKAAAYYIKDGKETPTKWCTRVDKYYYNNYSEDSPLYIIRNMKNGKSYQIAFTIEYGICFLDQDDEDGDEITGGDLSKIPDELLKHIRDERIENGRTLYDYKQSIKNKPEVKVPKGKVSSYNSTNNPFNENAKYGKIVDLGDGVCKKEVINFSHDVITGKKLDEFFDMDAIGRYIPYKEQVGNRDKMVVYFLKNKPEAMMAKTTRKMSWDKESDGKKRDIFGGIYQSKKFQELPDEERYKIEEKSDEDFGDDKHKQRHKANGPQHYVDAFNKAFRENKQKIIETVNKSNVFNDSVFSKLTNFDEAEYRKNEYTDSVRGKTLPHSLELVTKKGVEVLVYFTHERDGDGFVTTTTYNKADAVKIFSINGDDSATDTSGKPFSDAKKIALEIMKQIIKMPEYKTVNALRKKQGYDLQANNYNRKTGISNRQYLRKRDDYVREINRATYLDDRDGKRKYYGYEGLHLPIHEEVDYFPY